MLAVEFRSVTKSYGREKALDALSLVVESGRFTVLCGPPKSGKSTLFRLLVGLERADSGQILADGEDITDLPPGARHFGYVPQSFALYPHLTVFENIAYPLRLARVASSEVESRVDRATGMLSIGHLVKKTPDQLSGGEKQRVAIARGLLNNASTFVLDDPLVGLDYKLRERLMDDLKQLAEDIKATFFYATSDSLEALTMAKDLVVLDAGRIVEKADVLDVYNAPRYARSVELIGFPKANVWDCEVRAGRMIAGQLELPAPAGMKDARVRVGLRPEDVSVVPMDGNGLEATVRIVEHLGSEIVVYLDREGLPITAAFAASGTRPPRIDDKVKISIDPDRVMMFDPHSGARIETPRNEEGAAAHG